MCAQQKTQGELTGGWGETSSATLSGNPEMHTCNLGACLVTQLMLFHNFSKVQFDAQQMPTATSNAPVTSLWQSIYEFFLVIQRNMRPFLV